MSSFDRERYDKTRRNLDFLSISYAFPPESLPLVEKLTNDILAQKDKLQTCERFILDCQKEKEAADIGVEPYKRDNARLLQLNLELQKKLEDVQEQCCLRVNALKLELNRLESENGELDFIGRLYSSKIKDLEKEAILKNTKILELTSEESTVIIGGKKIELSAPISVNTEKIFENARVATESVEKIDILKIMEKRNGNLNKQMQELRQDNCKLSDMIVGLKRQLKCKDAEIARCKKAVEGGRPSAALRNECCCKCQQKDAAIHNLEQQLQEALDKQHEAMSRAVQLAERNEVLERELKEISKMASTLEDEYKRGEARQKEMEAMQERLCKSQEEIRAMEERLKEAREHWEVESKVSDKLKKEKRTLEMELGAVTADRKKLSDKMNQFAITEKELNDEVDRLRAANQTLHRRWTEKDNQNTCAEPACRSNTCPCKCPVPPRKSGYDPPWKSKRLRDKTDPKICGCAPSLLLLDKLQQERDHYHQECHILREQMCKTHAPSCSNQARDHDLRGGSHEESFKLLLDRVERERDVALADLRRVEQERDSLRERVNQPVPHYSQSSSELERILSGVVNQQGMNRGSLSVLERQCEDYRVQLRTCQAELAQVNTLYSQLKALHEQTDRSFSGTQGRLIQLESELTHAQTKARELEKSRWDLEEKVALLSREKMAVTQNLVAMEKDKDDLVMNLDDKTERLARLEMEIKKRDSQVVEANNNLAQMEKKFELTLSEKTTRDHAYRTLEQTLERVRHDFDQVRKEADALRSDNRRLQDELSSALRDGHAAHHEVDLCRQEVVNLKRQLQQYVSEVEKAEELIARKEKEQTEMLNNFHTLTIEASSLENSNHTLETEVVATKTAVEDLTRHVHDMETQLIAKDSIINDCEQKISTLSSNVMDLEARLDTQSQMRSRAEQDLAALRNLCSALDGQKEKLRVQATTADDERSSIHREVRRLSEECTGLRDTLNRERAEAADLRDSLNHSRQETMKHEMSNKDLASLVRQLRRSVDELTDKLNAESGNVRRYQEQCADLGKIVSELRREVTNARYESSRSSDQHTGNIHETAAGIVYEERETSSRGVPPLPMPESSDVSTVSSEFYLSPDDHDNGTYRVLSERSNSWSEDISSICRRPLSDIIENSLSIDESCEGASYSRTATRCAYYGTYWK